MHVNYFASFNIHFLESQKLLRALTFFHKYSTDTRYFGINLFFEVSELNVRFTNTIVRFVLPGTARDATRRPATADKTMITGAMICSTIVARPCYVCATLERSSTARSREGSISASRCFPDEYSSLLDEYEHGTNASTSTVWFITWTVSGVDSFATGTDANQATFNNK